MHFGSNITGGDQLEEGARLQMALWECSLEKWDVILWLGLPGCG